jgi:hypothetical protein
MVTTQDLTSATPLTACDFFQLLLEADKYPYKGNEDVPVAIAMTRDALEKTRMAVMSPSDPRSTTISNRRTDNDWIGNHEIPMG